MEVILARMKEDLKNEKVEDVQKQGQTQKKREDLTKDDLLILEKEEVPPWEEYELTKNQYMEILQCPKSDPVFYACQVSVSKKWTVWISHHIGRHRRSFPSDKGYYVRVSSAQC